MVGVRKEYQNQIVLRLNDPITTAKTYWSILKTFYNGNKVPIIHPLVINDKLISDFEVKANHFNNYLESQCVALENSDKIPGNQTYITNTKLSAIKLENKHIINIIRPLSVSKAHDHITFSIRLLKLCHSVIVEPLSTIFNNCMN